MEQQIDIKENDLELVVSEKTLGSLTTNARQIRDIVKNALPKYDISNYNDDNIDQAKKDKASLNKAAKALNAKRLEIEKEFMKPFGEFKEIVTETVKLINECSSKIDTIVKQNEQQYKDNKRTSIAKYYDSVNNTNVPIDKIFKQEWLNKSASMKSICLTIDSIIRQINDDIESLKAYDEDFTALSTYYCETLNLINTIQYANKLKEQRERAKRAEEERIKAEEARKIAEQEKREAEEKLRQSELSKVIEEKPVSQNPFDKLKSDYDSSNGIKVEEKPQILTRAFKVTTTRENIIALGDFMNERGIEFDKIEI